MKMKQYLRGLATGIVIAVAVMSLFQRKQDGLSDEEIRERAAELGMVMAESSTLSGGQRVPSGGETQESYQEPHSREDEEPDTGAAGGETQESYQEPLPSEDEEPDTSAAGGEGTDASDDGNGGSMETEEGSGGTNAPEDPSETQESEGTEQSQQPDEDGESVENTAETVVITIYPGDGSYTVSRYLQQAGLVDDVDAYDEYLCDNGYDNAIRVGQIQIPAGSSYEEIARLLTSRH